MHRRTILFVGLTMFLASCAFPMPPERPQEQGTQQSSAVSSAAVTEAAMIDGEGERPPTTEEFTGTGALAERLLPSGTLEIGNRDAPLSLLLFTEHHCEYCREFQSDLFPRLREDFLKHGSVRLEIVILPLKKYPGSREAAGALLCAGEQGKGLLMHEALLKSTDTTSPSLPAIGKALALEKKVFETCLASSDTEKLLAGQAAWERSLGVDLVPTFFLNGEKLVGLPSYADLRGKIERALKEAQK